MLDDAFPAMYQILQRTKNPGDIERLQWERRQRVKFSRTVRRCVRDTFIYSASHCWSAQDSNIADKFITLLRAHRTISDEELLNNIEASTHGVSSEDLRSVWEKLQRFPHIFEVANARGTIDHLDLRGKETKLTLNTKIVSRVHLQGWAVDLRDFQEFAERIKMSPSLFEFFAQSFRRSAPFSIHLSKHYKTAKK